MCGGWTPCFIPELAALGSGGRARKWKYLLPKEKDYCTVINTKGRAYESWDERGGGVNHTTDRAAYIYLQRFINLLALTRSIKDSLRMPCLHFLCWIPTAVWWSPLPTK